MGGGQGRGGRRGTFGERHYMATINACESGRFLKPAKEQYNKHLLLTLERNAEMYVKLTV